MLVTAVLALLLATAMVCSMQIARPFTLQIYVWLSIGKSSYRKIIYLNVSSAVGLGGAVSARTCKHNVVSVFGEALSHYKKGKELWWNTQAGEMNSTNYIFPVHFCFSLCLWSFDCLSDTLSLCNRGGFYVSSWCDWSWLSTGRTNGSHVLISQSFDCNTLAWSPLARPADTVWLNNAHLNSLCGGDDFKWVYICFYTVPWQHVFCIWFVNATG